MNGDEQLLTLEDVAERLKVSVSTVRRWVRSNELRSIKVGNRGQYRIGLKDLEEFLAEQPDTTAVTALKRGREWKEAIDWARNHTKYIVVTGGVISGLGKGIAAASIGKLLNSRLSVVPIKCDGYLNTDPGTMNPIEHGEVFVLDDGGEVDMDFGHYERFLGVNCPFEWNLTMGKVYKTILEQEREGYYLGQTVQLIPHVTDVIKDWLYEIPGRLQTDIGLIEIGGTVGDMENELYLEAVRQLRQEVGEQNVLFVHLTYVPMPAGVEEQKSKPTQQSVKLLNERGIRPDVIIGRCAERLTEKIKQKIALFCNIDKSAVISGVDVPSVYQLPLVFEEEGLTEIVHKRLTIYSPPQLMEWRELVHRLLSPTGPVIRVAICGKYTNLHDSYASVIEALRHSGAHVNVKVEIDWLDTMELERNKTSCPEFMSRVDAVIVPGGFGTRGIEGKIEVIRYCRENGIPFLGICYGMQLAVVEFARNVVGLPGAHTMEAAENGADVADPVICILPDQIGITQKGGTMRLGGQDVALKEGSRASALYRNHRIRERFRHRYEVNPDYIPRLEAAGMVFSGHDSSGRIMQVMELPEHPYFLGCQYHPELTSKLEHPAPLFHGLIQTAYEMKTGTRTLHSAVQH